MSLKIRLYTPVLSRGGLVYLTLTLAIWLLSFKQKRMQFRPIKDDSFVERVAKNNSWNNGDRHKIHEIFQINCFVFVQPLVPKTVHSSAMTQIKAHLMEKALQLTVPK